MNKKQTYKKLFVLLMLFTLFGLTNSGGSINGAAPSYIAGDRAVYNLSGVVFNMRYLPNQTFPAGVNDRETATVTAPYWMAETEVTYELWAAVYSWATANGYTFTRAGTMGYGSGVTNQHPVTAISWRDSIVWLNALTEYYNYQNGTNLSCVYKSGSVPIRNATDAATCDAVVPDDAAKGFRLPASMEWELAVRYRGGDSTNTILMNGVYWTKGIFPEESSGPDDIIATRAMAWFWSNSGGSTHPVAVKAQNVLGLYDLIGNVEEWCFDLYGAGPFRAFRGGGWITPYSMLTIGRSFFKAYPDYAASNIGFRLVRTQ
jgi:sulfatase modifying factor 1